MILVGHMHLISCAKIMMFVNLLLILAFSIRDICANEPVIVHTQYGDVLAYQTSLARVVYGIPFAQPPIGPLR
jgi:hypothetical protein